MPVSIDEFAASVEALRLVMLDIRDSGASGTAKVAAQYENVGAFGVKLDGSAAQITPLLNRAAAAYADARTILAGKGTLAIDQHMDLSGVSIDFGAVKMIAADGMRARLANDQAAIQAGGKSIGGNVDFVAKRLWFNGNGAANGYTVGSPVNYGLAFPAIDITGDQGPMNSYEIAVANHNGPGVRVTGDSEKKTLMIRAYQVTDTLLHIRQDPDEPSASPDEIMATLSAASVTTAYRSDEGLQCSTNIMFNVEQLRPAAGRAGVEVYGGKAECFSGELRGAYGTLVKVCRTNTGSSSGGADVTLRDLLIVQSYDGPALHLVNPKNASGKVYIRIADTGQTVGNAAVAANPGWTDTQKALAYAVGGPSVLLQSCHRTYGLTVQLERCRSQWGVQIGDATAVDGALKRMIGHRIPLIIAMGNDFTDPFLFTALRLNAAKDCVIDCTGGLKGNIQIDVGGEGCTVLVKADWIRAGGAVTVHPFATTELRITTPINSYEILDWPHRFAGLVAESVTDMGGATLRYDGAKWVSLSGALIVSDIVMASQNSWLNTYFKGRKVAVLNGDQAQVYFAQGTAPTDAWTAGADSVTPTLTSHIGELQTRLTAAGGGTMPTAWRNKVDRTYIDLIDKGLWVPGDIDASLLKKLHMLDAPDAPAALLNILFDDLNATAVNAPTFTPYSGYTGDGTGAHLNLNWDVNANPHGCALDNFHLGAVGGAAGSLSQASMPDIGGHATTWQVRAHRFDGGNQIRMGTLAGVPLPVAQLPRHVIGVRAPGGLAYGYGSDMTPVSSDAAVVAGATLPTALYGMRAQDDYSADPIRALHAGAAITLQQARDLIAILA